MTQPHENRPAEGDPAQPEAMPADPGFASPLVLGIAGYVVFPILALVTAALGFILVLNDQLIAGVVFLVVVLQVWVIGGIWAHTARKRKLT